MPGPFFPISHASLFPDVAELDSTAHKNHWRSKYGIPKVGEAIVFASFNKHLKITPHVWVSWMNILRAVPAAVLVMLENPRDSLPNLQRSVFAFVACLRLLFNLCRAGSFAWQAFPHTQINLNVRDKRYFAEAGLAPHRLMFIPFVNSSEEHIHRVAMADVILDTPPWGAHTGAADALWCAVPLLTTPEFKWASTTDSGTSTQSMASRVALSLLESSGVWELVGTGLAEYTVRVSLVFQQC